MCLSLTTRHVRQQPMGRTTATTMAAVMPACLELCCFRAAERTERRDTALFHPEGSRVRNASSCQPPTLPPLPRAWFKQFPLPFVVRPRLAGREEHCERETSKGVVGRRGRGEPLRQSGGIFRCTNRLTRGGRKEEVMAPNLAAAAAARRRRRREVDETADD